jgi:hypothetical protein
MKKILAAVAFAGLAGLTACAPAGGSGTETSAPTTETSSAPAPSPSSSKSASGASGAKEACEKFNSLYAEYKALDGTDKNAYEDIYFAAQDAKDTVSGNLRGLFTAVSVIALDRSSAVDSGGQPEQASKDAVRDAVFANANECTAAGVTLRL